MQVPLLYVKELIGPFCIKNGFALTASAAAQRDTLRSENCVNFIDLHNYSWI